MAALPFAGRCTIPLGHGQDPSLEGAMIDFERLRQSMVDSQIRPNDVTDPRVIAAMLELPRERFVPPARADLAYLDDDLVVREASATGAARYLLEPMIMAKLVQALDLSDSDRVLDVGCATGYSTALLSRLARAVVGLESDLDLAAAARSNLAELGLSAAQVAVGAMTAGSPESGPYDAILINGAVEIVPERLLQQLKDGGRLVAVVRAGPVGRATLYVRSGGTVSARPLFDAAIPPLPGFEAPRGFVF
jgi:protein-L-isoaspartate(D-aspartate) O-methyltransferase